MNKAFRIFLIMIFCLFTCLATYAKNITKYSLKNGLQIFVKVDKRSPVVVSQIWYRVGSSYEPLGLTGISHMLEHMMFQGTKKYPPGKLMQLVYEHGGLQNAATSFDYTMYYQELPAKNLALSFKLESDRMTNLLLAKKRFAKEIQVVREERRLRTDNNPQALTFERFYATANIARGYQHPIIGWMNDLNHLNVTDLKKWYQQYYTPNNATLVVVGDVQPKKVYLLAKKYFGKIKSYPAPTIKPQNYPQTMGERNIITHLPAEVPTLFMGYNVPVIKTAQNSWSPYALAIISTLLSGGNSSRLDKEIIRKQQIAAQATTWYNPFSRLSNIFVFVAIPTKNNSVQKLKQALLTQIKKLQTSSISLEELQKVKTQLIAQRIFQKDSLTAQAYEIGMLETTGLSFQDGEKFITEIKKITPQQIKQAAREFFISQRLTTGILNPKKI